ncbi:hypothetical protein F7725_012683 [Dissostichus mawsoni]|uniref:Uncharacterized protein n=1 Tax=Dissostichus mawsoni TaxID=36200 RepID=A0A7J5YPL7_DISMA|nr:hypothetical protein F7725_012683 [Dissostichus mawsoni]
MSYVGGRRKQRERRLVELDEAFDKQLKPDPLVAILGSTGDTNLNYGSDKWPVFLGAVLAKKLILRFWKSDAVPTFEMWLREVGEILYLEKLRFKNAGRGRVFDKAWAPVMRHLRGLGEDEGVG